MTPASARPFPLNLPPLFFTLTIAMIPRINPNSAVRPQVNIPKTPSTSEVTARPLVFGAMAGVVAAKGGGAGLFNTS